MKAKTFTLLLVACGVLGVAAYLLIGTGKKEEQQSRLGEKVYTTLPVNEIVSIHIKAAEESVDLKKENIWGVENRYNYPADFGKIRDFVDKIAKMKIGREFSASPKTLDRLGLNPPDKKETVADQKGVRITFQAKDNKIIADLLVGKAREADSGYGGHYIKPAGSSIVYLVDENLRYMEKQPNRWLKKELLDIKAADIKKVICRNPENENPVYTLVRPEKGKDAELMDPDKQETIDTSKINSVLGVLTSMSIEDVADPKAEKADTGMEQPACLEYHLFDGTVYKIYPGKPVSGETDKYYARTEASYQMPPAPEADVEADSAEKEKEKPELPIPVDPASKKGENKDEKPAPPEPTPEELSAKADQLNEKISTWTYVLLKWKFDNLIIDKTQFYKKKEEKADS